MDPNYKSAKAVTTGNAHTLTTYELRQELELRGKMDLAVGAINHKSLLQRLVQELVAQESQAAQSKVDSDAARIHEQCEAGKAQREQRKAEALERSRQRQADPSYFAKRAEANVAGKEELDAKKAGGGADSTDDKEEEEEEEDVTADDPFRTTKAKGKNKIVVR